MPESNTEFVMQLMDQFGVLGQAFIIEGIRRYAEHCSTNRLADNALVNPEAWQGIAKKFLSEIENRRF